MPLSTNLNVSPYFDDFSADNDFAKVLFKPGYPVQTIDHYSLLGFYKAADVQTTVVVDKIRSSFGDDIICGLSTGNKRSIKKQIKGIVLCTDENGRGGRWRAFKICC